MGVGFTVSKMAVSEVNWCGIGILNPSGPGDSHKSKMQSVTAVTDLRYPALLKSSQPGAN